MTKEQKRALTKLRSSLEEAARIFTSTKDAKWIAGRRWLFALNQLREGNGWLPFHVEEVERLLAQMHLCATQALNAPEAYFCRYVLPPGPISERILAEKGDAHVRQMIEDARDILGRKPKNRAFLLIGRALERHIADSLMGVVPRLNDRNEAKGATHVPQGPAVRFGQAIVERWGMGWATRGELREAWRQLPEKRFPARRM